MKHTYKIVGRIAAHEMSGIQDALEAIPGIESAEVTADPPGVTISMHHHVAEDVLNTALAEIGDYHLEMIMGPEHGHMQSMHPSETGTHTKGGHEHHAHHDMGEHTEHGHMGHGHMGHEHMGHEHMGHEHMGHEHMGHEHMDHMGHGDHHRMMIADFKKRFWISLALSVPILVLSPMIQHWLGFDWSFPGSQYVLFALSTIVYVYGGWPFLKGLFDEVRGKAPGMMTLIGMAISVAYFYSAATTFGLPGKSFYWELVTLIVIMLIGHWIEMKSVLGASRALELLVGMMPSVAHKVQGGEIMDVQLETLAAGDLIMVKPGEKVPADSIITEGESYLNESMLTGESKPVRKQQGMKMIGGSLNGNGALRARVEHTGKDSYLTKVITMVQEAQRTKSKMQGFADRAAKWLTYIALTSGVITLVVWLAIGKDFVYALERMVTVMVISCPHALGLAIPLVVAISTAISARNGLLIRNRTAFEEARNITAIVFDKTGTLTTGTFGVTRYEALGGMANDDMLRLAGALEQTSEHPIAIGIVRKLKELNIEIPNAGHFEALPGKGVQATVEGKRVQILGPGFLKEQHIPIPEHAFGSAAETVVFVVVDGTMKGYIALADAVRPESKSAIETLRQNHIKIYMATGDNETVGKAVSEELALDGYYAGVLPHQKVEIVKDLQAKGEFVAMTGDGVNDAPALAQADVGIAVGSGTDVAAETADIILVNSNPRDIANLILFGKATYQKMVQNLAWATGYNAIAIPLAAGVLYAYGIVLSPAVGAILMSLSTVIVAVNAQLLKRGLKA